MEKEDAPVCGKPGSPDRIQINMRLTAYERDFIREQSSRLHMKMSEYVIKRSVYDAQSTEEGSPDTEVLLLDSLNGVWDQLREASIALSDLRDQAAYLSRDTRSALARSLSGRMLDMCDVVERDMVTVLAALGKVLGDSRKRRA